MGDRGIIARVLVDVKDRIEENSNAFLWMLAQVMEMV